MIASFEKDTALKSLESAERNLGLAKSGAIDSTRLFDEKKEDKLIRIANTIEIAEELLSDLVDEIMMIN